MSTVSDTGRTEPSVLRYSKPALAGLVLSLLLAACAGGDPDMITYRDIEDRSLFELPREWHLYRADELIRTGPLPFLPDTGGSMLSYVAFDGAAGRSLDNLITSAAASPYPLGAQIIRRISPEEKNLLSNRFIAESAYDTYSPGLGVQIIDLVEDPSFDRDYDGIRGYLGVTQGDNSLEGVIYVRAGHNPDVTEMYSMAVGCSLECFTRDRQEIEQAVNSWVVNTRK